MEASVARRAVALVLGPEKNFTSIQGIPAARLRSCTHWWNSARGPLKLGRDAWEESISAHKPATSFFQELDRTLDPSGPKGRGAARHLRPVVRAGTEETPTLSLPGARIGGNIWAAHVFTKGQCVGLAVLGTNRKPTFYTLKMINTSQIVTHPAASCAKNQFGTLRSGEEIVNLLRWQHRRRTVAGQMSCDEVIFGLFRVFSAESMRLVPACPDDSMLVKIIGRLARGGQGGGEEGVRWK